jgi:hypothetical protein
LSNDAEAKEAALQHTSDSVQAQNFEEIPEQRTHALPL